VFGTVLLSSRDQQLALSVALCCAAFLTCGALALAVAELRARRHRAQLSEHERDTRKAETSAADVQRG
jgi:hypothetical protein